MKVPFLDLQAQYLSIKKDIDEAIASVISDTAFIKGKYVSEFESAFAQTLGLSHCIGVANGTDAIYIALKMLGIGPGDEVITTACTWISSSETISQTGATPVFVDIDPDYYTINTTLIESSITPRTKALVIVHLYGQAADLEPILQICKKHKLFLIEDCAQSHLTTYQGKPVGTFGDVATFSFYPGKNLGAYGDAGAIVTNNDELALKMRMYANHGALIKHQHEMEGINSRLDGLHASVLSVKLPHLKNWNEKRIKHAHQYTAELCNVKEVSCPVVRDHSAHTFHLYVVRCEKRAELQAYLAERGIDTQVHYPVPLPFMNAYRYLGYLQKDFPVAAKYQDQILSLPIFPEMTEAQISYVTQTIKAFYRS